MPAGWHGQRRAPPGASDSREPQHQDHQDDLLVARSTEAARYKQLRCEPDLLKVHRYAEKWIDYVIKMGWANSSGRLEPGAQEALQACGFPELLEWARSVDRQETGAKKALQAYGLDTALDICDALHLCIERGPSMEP